MPLSGSRSSSGGPPLCPIESVIHCCVPMRIRTSMSVTAEKSIRLRPFYSLDVRANKKNGERLLGGFVEDFFAHFVTAGARCVEAPSNVVNRHRPELVT